MNNKIIHEGNGFRVQSIFRTVFLHSIDKTIEFIYSNVEEYRNLLRHIKINNAKCK